MRTKGRRTKRPATAKRETDGARRLEKLVPGGNDKQDSGVRPAWSFRTRPGQGRGKAAATIPAQLTFEDVSRRYEDVRALDRVSLDVKPSEVVALLGHSGCGKTTLLRIAAGIEKPSGGRVLIDGLEVAGSERFVPPEKRNVGLMFQDFALFPHLTLLQNVAFGLRSLPKAEAKRIAMTGLERVGLADLATEYPARLSGGEQQRVALARAIAPRPGVLLMDEPFSGLDVDLRASMQEETLAILRETRATSVIVTHDPEEAMRLSERIVVMKSGRILQEGTAETLYRAPQALFVARLFSEVAELRGRIQGGAADSPFGRMPAPGLKDGSEAIICLRQRSITLLPAGQGVAARVIGRRFLGEWVALHLAVDGLEEPLAVRVAGEGAPVPGAEVGLQVDAATVSVFPSETRLSE
ncbi:MAG: ABC transporter ATP-binding protein [Hyphomicrobiaceae bacterium]